MQKKLNIKRHSIVVTNTNPGGPDKLKWKEDTITKLAPSQVVIETHYCSVNFPDLLMTTGAYQLKPKLPFTLGSEAVGQIIFCGDKVKHLKGEIVHALTWHGAFTTHLVVDAATFKSRPDAMSEVQKKPSPSTLLRAPLTIVPKSLHYKRKKIAAMGFVYSTAYYALKNCAELKAEQKVLILGASGGIGLASIQISKLMGANEIVAAARTKEELELCAKKGATSAIECNVLLNRKHRKEELKDFDVVIDTLGGIYTEPAVKTVRPGGRLIILGFASEPDNCKNNVRTGLVLVKECTMIGCQWGAWASRVPAQQEDNMRQLMHWLREKWISPHIHDHYASLENVHEALTTMDKGGILGKVVLNSK